MSDVLQELIGRKVRIEADGNGVVTGTLEASELPWVRLRTEKGQKLRCIPVHRVFYIEAAD